MTTANEDHQSPVQITALQRLLEQRVSNPFLGWILRSHLHWLVSRWVLLVSYTGRQSGRRYTFPVVYNRWNERLIVVTPKHESSWWKNFTTPLDCSVWLRGAECSATGVLVSDGERVTMLAEYFETYQTVGQLLHLNPEPESAAEQYDELAVIQFRL